MATTPTRHSPIKPSSVPAVDSPGTWRHPRIDEINRRRNATTFSEKNVRQIACNIAALLGLLSVQLIARLSIDPYSVSTSVRQYLGWVWFAIQLIPVFNVGVACLPLLKPKDDLSDIPLTPAQRKLLGLPLAAAVPTPEAQISTPPRYSRTPSLAGSIGNRGSYPNSPLSGRGSPVLNPSSGSPYSPISSPLFQKGLNSLSNRRRSSFSSSTQLGNSISSSSFGNSISSNMFSDGGSPSPSPSKRTSVGLNSKWLYEKGRRPSGSAWLH